MPNPNISAVLAPADKVTIKANIDANAVIIDVFGVNLTPEQRKGGAKTGPDSVSFVADCLSVGKLHSAAVPGDMTIGEFEKDVNLFNDLNELELHHKPYVEKISDTKVAVGEEAYRQALRIYNTVKELAKNNSTFETIRQQLSQRFALLQGPRPRTATQTLVLPPSSSVAIINIVDQTPVKNTGSTDLMVCNGTLPRCTAGSTITPGTSINIPTSVTSVTVTNLNGDNAGSFTIKTNS